MTYIQKVVGNLLWDFDPYLHNQGSDADFLAADENLSFHHMPKA